jgi:hypothetical protein
MSNPYNQSSNMHFTHVPATKVTRFPKNRNCQGNGLGVWCSISGYRRETEREYRACNPFFGRSYATFMTSSATFTSHMKVMGFLKIKIAKVIG